MTARNLKTRIEKLEASRRHVDETLVIWRRPGADVASALTNVRYAPGDRVICLEWHGEGPIPEPKWHRDVREGLSDEGNQSLDIVLERCASGKMGRRAIVELSSDVDLNRYSDSELLYFLFGVAT
jgi:hypothetical protein